ncbi:MAG: DNA topoisomerase 1 [Chlamydiales bacterium]|nr:DNA topoisomerase 1 [Chlamydiales bacterium]MCH9634855.1 DNA topoisomerase 1 [Chlamydiales bacterium]MCH9704078.1 type I DNA topoisomerase [Chlamydiota bacterium]
MTKSLIIVESPAKIKTLKKFLGKDFLFESSVGHIRDLPQKGFGIDVENDFEPEYQTLPDKKDVISKLKKAAKQADVVYLAPDPDREGEAIAWHIAEILPKGTKIARTTFNAITKEAVLDAIKSPRELDQALIDAQQARRLLDRIVGYKISPILARKLQQRSGVSAGRVQSVALKLVVDREKLIEAFKPVEYWNLGALLKLHANGKHFSARVHTIDGLRWEKEPVDGKEVALIRNEEEATAIEKRLSSAKYTISRVERKEKKRNPEPPFITSTLQQEASRHHRFSSNKTMNVAQTLYEGVDLKNEGTEGLITYMRTDSVRLAPEALTAARSFIKDKFGDKYLPAKPRQYTTKKSAQDAHEAIRPTNLDHPPELVKPYLTRDQFQIYSLIWDRFIASQMTPAIYDTISADIDTDQNIMLRATGSTLKFKGFLALYEEMHDDDDGEQNSRLPPLEVEQRLDLMEVTKEQSFTKPPPRFTEASLVKELEKSGIGRPSTYASIMGKIQGRSYTTKEKMRLKPTELGCVIAAFLEDNFGQIMNIGFTAEMEDALEEIAGKKKAWKDLLRNFWKDFIPTVETAANEAYVPKLETDIQCPKCKSATLQKIWSKSRYFYGCATYPECDFTASLEELNFDKSNYAEGFDWSQNCPLCSEPMKLRHGRFGAFLGCTKYPDCKGIVSIPKKGEELVQTQNLPSCPAKGCPGKLISRKSRFGKIFFSCSTFPDCNVIVNDLAEVDKKYPDHERTAYEKKGKGGGGGLRGKLKPSKELAAVIGDEKVTRGEAIKKMWIYIKEENLQDPSDKRRILADEKLAAVFGSTEPLSMFQLSGVLAKHLSK